MKWPRGKYNGRRIMGIDFHIKIQCEDWFWLPLRVKYCGGLHWLCFMTWTQFVYE